VSQQPAYPVFCFEGLKVPYPISSFLPDTKLSWRNHTTSGATPSVFPLDLVLFHFI